MSEKIGDIYGKGASEKWQGEKTMEHASGVWGRDKMLTYLRDEVINQGDTVVDLGSGGGYPTVKIAEMVGESGRVIGLERSLSQLGIEDEQEAISEKYEDMPLEFQQKVPKSHNKLEDLMTTYNEVVYQKRKVKRKGIFKFWVDMLFGRQHGSH